MSRTDPANPLLDTLVMLIHRAHSQDARDSFAMPILDGAAWNELVEEADRQGVVGQLYFALRGNSDLAIPAESMSELETRYKRNHLDNWLRAEIAAQLVQELETAHIPVMVLKGAALATLVYEDIGLRPYVDVDLLVNPENGARAQELIR